jgi:hypothetical protein
MPGKKTTEEKARAIVEGRGQLYIPPPTGRVTVTLAQRHATRLRAIGLRHSQRVLTDLADLPDSELTRARLVIADVCD